jgi:hypothetical protein
MEMMVEHHLYIPGEKDARSIFFACAIADACHPRPSYVETMLAIVSSDRGGDGLLLHRKNMTLTPTREAPCFHPDKHI